jgi:hypothetical protein
MPYTPEQAVAVLQFHSELAPEFKEYWEAIRDGKLPEYHLPKLKDKRFGYSDETPAVDVRTLITDTDNFTRFKCQTNYLMSLTGQLRDILDNGLLSSSEIGLEVETFLGENQQFTIGDPDNPTKIARINQILDLVISNLESQGLPELHQVAAPGTAESGSSGT